MTGALQYLNDLLIVTTIHGLGIATINMLSRGRGYHVMLKVDIKVTGCAKRFCDVGKVHVP